MISKNRSEIKIDKIKKKLLKHYLAALAYRTQKALKDAPNGFGNFNTGAGIRTPHEIVKHMTSVIGYARTFFIGGEWHPEMLKNFDAEIERFHKVLEELGKCLDSEKPLINTTYERLLQGPLSDAMTHAGQLSMLRRLAGSPIKAENFIYANINTKNLSKKQPKPFAPDPVKKKDTRE